MAKILFEFAIPALVLCTLVWWGLKKWYYTGLSKSIDEAVKMDKQAKVYASKLDDLKEESMHNAVPWIAVDFDGTLAEYNGWSDELGAPIPQMVERVHNWVSQGIKVKIFTARVGCSGSISDFDVPDEVHAAFQRSLIENWCEKYLGFKLEVTASKDFAMVEMWDDRAVQVETNTGVVIGKSMRGYV